ncbi:MAG: sodium:proton antiporter [Candidatus Kapaibacterium sp.]
MEHHAEVPLYSIIPFVLMLGAIAVLPLAAHRFWESNRNKLIIALSLGIPTAVYLFATGMSHEFYHIIFFDYVPFIILLGGLFVITGGIYVETNLRSRPLVNTIIMAIGALLASFMGTTGAAMLLIRPLINTNKDRKSNVHTILFFIAIVANCGGLLTPLGDPPLFMMYLRGADFFWFTCLFREWAFTNAILLLIYFLFDSYKYRKDFKDSKQTPAEKISIKLQGKRNFILLLGVILAVAFINSNTLIIIKQNANYGFIREFIILVMALLSLKLTRRETRLKNKFSWEPIQEVTYLFIGIFITMVPALEYLKIHANELGITSASQFYYATGLLSGFLDNTPTAVTFYYLQVGIIELHPEMLIPGHIVAGIPDRIMEAISAGAVFFGSMTYIGNGPNFMVKAIAENRNIKMPDFFSYMFKFSLIVLLPIFILVQLLFI